jgi:hypothetical protein
MMSPMQSTLQRRGLVLGRGNMAGATVLSFDRRASKPQDPREQSRNATELLGTAS